MVYMIVRNDKSFQFGKHKLNIVVEDYSLKLVIINYCNALHVHMPKSTIHITFSICYASKKFIIQDAILSYHVKKNYK